MSPEGFLRRLEAGKVVNCVYRSSGVTGLISAWKHEASYVLTWEECPEGEQYNESRYLKDARHFFDTPEAVLKFIVDAGYPPSAFSP